MGAYKKETVVRVYEGTIESMRRLKAIERRTPEEESALQNCYWLIKRIRRLYLGM